MSAKFLIQLCYNHQAQIVEMIDTCKPERVVYASLVHGFLVVSKLRPQDKIPLPAISFAGIKPHRSDVKKCLRNANSIITLL